MHPSLFSQIVIGQLTPMLIRLGKHAHSKRRKATPTQSLLFHVKFMCLPC